MSVDKHWAGSRCTEVGRRPFWEQAAVVSAYGTGSNSATRISVLQAMRSDSPPRSISRICIQAFAGLAPSRSGKLGVSTPQPSPLFLNTTGSRNFDSQFGTHPLILPAASICSFFGGEWVRDVFSGLHLPIHYFSGKAVDYVIGIQPDPMSWW